MSRTCSTAWCSSMRRPGRPLPRPPTSARPARSATARRRRRAASRHPRGSAPATASVGARQAWCPRRRPPRERGASAGVASHGCGPMPEPQRAAAAQHGARSGGSRTHTGAGQPRRRQGERRGRGRTAAEHDRPPRRPAPGHLADRPDDPRDVGVGPGAGPAGRPRRPTPTVLQAPPTRTVPSASSSSGSTACLSGMVSDRPAHQRSSPSRNPGSPAPSTSTALYDQPASPSAAYAAGCSTGDSECATGRPRTAARGQPAGGRPGLSHRQVALVVRVLALPLFETSTWPGAPRSSAKTVSPVHSRR